MLPAVATSPSEMGHSVQWETSAQLREAIMEDQYSERLVNCFGEVFPNLNRASIPSATHSGIAEWDSIAQVTLLSLIGEEFAIEIDFEDFEDATSFSAILELVRAKAGDGSASSQKAV